MKKTLLSLALLLGLSQLPAAHAQAGALVNLVGLGLRLGTQAALKKKPTPAKEVVNTASPEATAQQAAAQQAAIVAAGPAQLSRQRIPADQLPKQAAAQITHLETQLDACHAAMLASPTGPVCTPAQRATIQSTAVEVARAKPGFDLHPYQQEMAYYLAEDARRQQAAAPAEPAK